MKTTKIYQIKDLVSNDERFCFNAENEEVAKDKFMNWLRRHDYVRIKAQFLLKEVIKPVYRNNIRNEWVN